MSRRTKNIIVTVSPEEHRALKTFCSANQLKITDVVRARLQDLLASAVRCDDPNQLALFNLDVPTKRA